MFTFIYYDKNSSTESKYFFKLSYFKLSLLLFAIITIAFTWKYFYSKKNLKGNSDEKSKNIEVNNKNKTTSEMDDNNPYIDKDSKRPVTKTSSVIEREGKEVEIKEILNEILDKWKRILESLSDRENKITCLLVLVSTFRVPFTEIKGENGNKGIVTEENVKNALRDIMKEGIKPTIKKEKINFYSSYLTLKESLQTTLFYIKESFSEVMNLENEFNKNCKPFNEIQLIYDKLGSKLLEYEKLRGKTIPYISFINEYLSQPNMKMCDFINKKDFYQRWSYNKDLNEFHQVFPLKEPIDIRSIEFNSQKLVDFLHSIKEDITSTIEVHTHALEKLNKLENIEGNNLKFSEMHY